MKNLPSVSQAVTLINACAGHALVRNKDCAERTATHIDFEVSAKRFNLPLNYTLQLLWRSLGAQTSTRYGNIGERRAVYEWNFAPPAGKLQLMLMADGRVLISLVNESIERRANA